MKHSTLIFFLLATTVARAQILESSSLPQIGDVYNEYSYDASNTNIGSSGQNVVWDFSSVLGSFIQTIQIRPAEDGIKSAMFLEANQLNERANGDEYYYSTNEDYYSFVGAFRDRGDLIENYFLDTKEIVVTPLRFGEVKRETFAGNLASGGIHINRSGEIEMVLDGTGTLILPYATFSNAMRIQVKYSFVDDYGGTSSLEYQEIHFYWFDANYRGPLMTHITGRYINQPLPDYHEGIYQIPSTTSIASSDRESKNQVKYSLDPNRISITGLPEYLVEIDLIAIDGRCLGTYYCSKNQNEIDLSAIPTGHYIIVSESPSFSIHILRP